MLLVRHLRPIYSLYISEWWNLNLPHLHNPALYTRLIWIITGWHILKNLIFHMPKAEPIYVHQITNPCPICEGDDISWSLSILYSPCRIMQVCDRIILRIICISHYARIIVRCAHNLRRIVFLCNSQSFNFFIHSSFLIQRVSEEVNLRKI